MSNGGGQQHQGGGQHDRGGRGGRRGGGGGGGPRGLYVSIPMERKVVEKSEQGDSYNLNLVIGIPNNIPGRTMLVKVFVQDQQKLLVSIGDANTVEIKGVKPDLTVPTVLVRVQLASAPNVSDTLELKPSLFEKAKAPAHVRLEVRAPLDPLPDTYFLVTVLTRNEQGVLASANFAIFAPLPITVEEIVETANEPRDQNNLTSPDQGIMRLRIAFTGTRATLTFRTDDGHESDVDLVR